MFTEIGGARTAVSRLSALQQRMMGTRRLIRSAAIRVNFHGEEVATLEKSNAGFRFRYCPEFSRSGLPALPGLTDARDTQWREFDSLPRFFRERIPDLNRPEIQEEISRLGIDRGDQFDLLSKLSRRAVTDPFELVLDSANPAA